MATRSCGKRAINRPPVCGVRPISGTNTNAVRPAAKVRSMSRIYTSVLPAPVTPKSKC